MIDKRHLEKWTCIEKIGDWEYCVLKANYVDSNKMTKIEPKEPLKMTKEIFERCPFKDKIFKNYTINFVILLGSGCYGAWDDISDYDLVIYINDKVDFNNINTESECLFYKNRKLHWAYANILLPVYNQAWYLIQLYFLENNVLYIKNDIELNKLLVLKKELIELGIAAYLYKYQTILLNYNIWINDESKLNFKLINVMGIIYSILNNTSIDVKFISILKRLRYNNMFATVKDKLYVILKFLYEYAKIKNYFDTNTITILKENIIKKYALLGDEYANK